MKQNLISIIVPVYNVEQYLPKCLDSIINQTYKNLEIILVNDGSTDTSFQICDEYAKKDKRIKVINKNYAGVSSARNTGIENATGKYISFIDSDDYINENFIQTLFDLLIETDSDMSMCNYIKVTPDDKIDLTIKYDTSNIKTYSEINKFKMLYDNNKTYITNIVVWNKLYKAEIFKNTNLRYADGQIHEDEIIIHKILNECKKIVFCDIPLYNYVKRKGSIMNQVMSERNLHVYNALEERILFFKEKYPELYTTSLYHLFYNITDHYFKYEKTQRKKVRQIFKNLKQNHKEGFKSFKPKQKLKVFLFKYFKLLLKIYYKISKT